MVSRRVRRRRRQFATVGGLLVIFLIYITAFSGGGPKKATPPAPHGGTARESFPAHSPLNPNWRGDGKPVTMAFGGDVHFEGVVGARLTADPTTALGNTVAQLLGGAQLRMVNLESALTNGTCPQQQSKPFIFYTPPTALTALHDASVSVIAQGNDHAVDCGEAGLAQGLAAERQAAFPVVGVGSNAIQAFAPYVTKINGERIAVLAATQIIAPDLVSTWSATSTQGGVALALDPTQLVSAVQKARRTSDTVVVYLHWGTETVACPNTQQQPLAQQLINAGADIVVGSGAHVLLGGGYLGSAYVDYGLGNFAFYDNTAPETSSGSLAVTATGRQITSPTWRPATVVAGLPQPLTGTPATTALSSWNAAQSCTGLTAAPAASQATEKGETKAFILPITTATAPTTTTTAAGSSTTTTAATSTTTTSKATATTTPKTTTTTSAPTTTTKPTDNAG